MTDFNRLAASRFLAILLAVAVAQTSAADPGPVNASADSPTSPPNVIFILTDDQGALDAGCYGATDLRTPAIDRLAREGVRFTNAYAHTVCCPARAMLMTGRHPQRGDVGSWTQGKTTAKPTGRNLLHREKCIAETFRDAGYRTALFGKWHLGAAETHGPTRQGFEQFFGIRGGFIDNYTHYYLHGSGHHDLYRGIEEQFRPGEYFMDMVMDETRTFLRQSEKSDEPFFLYLPLNLPHYPEQALDEYGDSFLSLQEPRRSYAKIVATTDAYVGRLLDELDRLELTDETIVVLASDNGYSREQYEISVEDHSSGLPKGLNYGANGGGGFTGKWRGSKGSFFEGGLRVPMIVRYPALLPQGRISETTVTLMDWYPTVIEMTGVEYDGPAFDGRSVLPFLNTPNDLKLVDDHYQTMHWGWKKAWAVRRGPWKLIVGGTRGLAGGGPRRIDNSIDRIFLANLDDAEPEAINHAKQHPSLVAELTASHESWAQEVAPPADARWVEK